MNASDLDRLRVHADYLDRIARRSLAAALRELIDGETDLHADCVPRDEARTERHEMDQLNGRLYHLLNGVFVALKGPHPPNGLHDLSDLPMITRRLVNDWHQRGGGTP